MGYVMYAKKMIGNWQGLSNPQPGNKYIRFVKSWLSFPFLHTDSIVFHGAAWLVCSSSHVQGVVARAKCSRRSFNFKLGSLSFPYFYSRTPWSFYPSVLLENALGAQCFPLLPLSTYIDEYLHRNSFLQQFFEVFFHFIWSTHARLAFLFFMKHCLVFAEWWTVIFYLRWTMVAVP